MNTLKLIKTGVTFIFLFCQIFMANSQVKITETSIHKRLHYKVETTDATYFIDRFSGGISSIIDKNGKDWVSWKRLEKESYPHSAAGDFRGIPNLVYGGDENGIGHPGFNTVITFCEETNRIRVRSLNMKWEFQYIFHSTFVEVQILSTPKNERNYWFLYEGTPGGEFNPEKNYWGTNKGIKSTKPNFLKGEEEYGNWKWVFFGHEYSKQTIFIAQKHDDDLKDTFAFLGNSESGLKANDGMIVFGFGRDKNAKPLLNKNTIFYIGFYNKRVNQNNFDKLEKYITKKIY